MINCIRYEFYKTFISNRIWVILVLFFVFQIALVTNNYAISEMELIKDNEETLSEWYNKWSGKLNEKSINEIEALSKRISLIDSEIDKIYSKVESGEISETEGLTLLNECYKIKGDKLIFYKFFSQYKHIKDDPENRTLCDLRGWEALFYFYNSLNFALLFFILIVSAGVFSSESQTAISNVVKTTRLGYKKVISAKLLSLMIVVFSACTVTLIIFIMSINAKYPLANGYSNIQSLIPYGNFPFRISLSASVLMMLAIQATGLIFISLICALISQISGKGYIGLFISLAIVLLPYFLFSETQFYFKLPLPVSMLMPSGYLKYIRFGVMDEGSQVKLIISKSDIIIISAMVCFTIIIIIFALTYNYLNKGLIKRRVLS